MTGSDLATDALATARIVHLIQEDDIPFGPVRDHLLSRYGHHQASDLLTCGWCLSVWVGAAVVAARAVAPRPWKYLARALAFSYATGKLESM